MVTSCGQAGAPDFEQEPGVLLDFTFRHKFEMWGTQFTAGFEARNLLGEVTSLAERADAFQVDRRRTGPNRVTEVATKRQALREDLVKQSSIKRLPAEAVSALTRPDDEWRQF